MKKKSSKSALWKTKSCSKLGNNVFLFPLVEGNYPDTNRLIPSSFNTEVEFSVPSFLAAIERASLLSHEGRNNIVRLSILPSGAAVVLYGNTPEIGKVEESLSYTASSGDPLRFLSTRII